MILGENDIHIYIDREIHEYVDWYPDTFSYLDISEIIIIIINTRSSISVQSDKKLKKKKIDRFIYQLIDSQIYN